MYTCADCGVFACTTAEKENMPKNCPMRNEENMDAIAEEYKKDAVREFHRAAAVVEAEGYCEWPRLRETMEFAVKMGYRKLGIAFCAGFKKEAKILAQLLRKNGFEVASVVCKTGGYDKSFVGIAEDEKICRGGFEAMCNPIAQAKILNAEKCEMDLMLGLCVGHDSLFLKYCEAPVTVVAVKDRLLGHAPLNALYSNYYAFLKK